ncbi:hypothetical protein GQ53DRAFT_687669 [Thozetella sp. PMI_491]|nr:hypothetical protein GQ53DRAFT_687669 [Thozetella sp. PMI_491]
MAFLPPGSATFQQAQPFLNSQFDIFEWHPYFQSCVRYFLDHAQYDSPVQALAAFVNIQLPFQRLPNPVLSSRSTATAPGGPMPSMLGTAGRAAGKIPLAASPTLPQGVQQPLACVPLVPYIRRLVATGCDSPAVLHGFFGDDWSAGVGWMHEEERRNYLFAAKSDNWLTVKAAYDMDDGQTIPFLRPLQNVSEKEIIGAESTWSEWLAMQDWMLGPRAPEGAGSPAQMGRASSGSQYGQRVPEAGEMGHGRAKAKRESP